jgi:8-amino-7-oxononanoate synthase
MSRFDALEQDLQQRRAQRLYRSRQVVESPQGVHLRIAGKDYLNFCSNDYLGLANEPRLVQAMCTTAGEFGAGAGAAHLVNGHMTPHHELEQELAAFVGRPRALLFSTGYMANVGVISALCAYGDGAFEDRLNHASLLDGALMTRARLQRFAHADAADLDNKLAASKAAVKLVASDGVFSMDGDSAPIGELAKVCDRHGAWLMIDDAHGLGVMGQTGRGSCEQQDVESAAVPILVGTLGKAFGSFGAFVAGEEPLIETLIQRARSYIYTTALPPAVAAATRVSLRIIQQEPQRRARLHDNIGHFRQCAAQAGIALPDSISPIQPIMVGEVEAALRLSDRLQQQGILVTAIRPPTVPQGSARLRVTLSAQHTHDEIARLVEALAEYLDV